MLAIIRKTALSALAFSVLGASAYAGSLGEPAYLAEIDTCIAELKSRVDINDVHRARYVVTDSKRTTFGFVLKFRTSFFTPTSESKYSVYCVAKGADTPVKFRWKKLDV